MKMPKRPPDWKPESYTQDQWHRIFSFAIKEDTQDSYYHWDRLLRRKPPGGLSVNEWWAALKFKRMSTMRSVPLRDKSGRSFRMSEVPTVSESLHTIDLNAGGRIEMADQITNPETRDRYYISSLIEESITSSMIEGATTTRQVAKEMLRTGRPPRDRSERMILNNFVTMRRIGELKNEPLSKDLVLEIQQIITDAALDNPDASGRFRLPSERVYVGDMEDQILHEPPDAHELEERMESMCRFANGETPDRFVHPVLRSILLHFWLAYDHPFVDGNGRTARALFYWSMLRHRYWMFEFISISPIILKAPSAYGRAFLYTETDDNDLTYFILYHLEVLHKAIAQLHDYIERKTLELRRIEVELRGMSSLNYRQKALISHALRHPDQQYTIESHRKSHNVVYQTARNDLLDLVNRGLMHQGKSGARMVFTPIRNLAERLAEEG